MANSLYTNPIYFDTTTGASVTGGKCIKGISWVSDSGAGLDIAADDDFLLSQTDGTKIIGKRAEAAGDGLDYVPLNGLLVDGITVTTLDGGVCYVFLE